MSIRAQLVHQDCRKGNQHHLLDFQVLLHSLDKAAVKNAIIETVHPSNPEIQIEFTSEKVKLFTKGVRKNPAGQRSDVGGVENQEGKVAARC